MKWHSSKSSTRAFTRVDLVVVIATLVLVAVILPLLRPSSDRHYLVDACRNNLRQVGMAFQLNVYDSYASFTTHRSARQGGSAELVGAGQTFVHFLALTNSLPKLSPKILTCPADKQKVAATNLDSGFSDENVSYFVGLDADENYPLTFLSGDRNLAANGQPLGKDLFVLSTNTSLGWTKTIHNLVGNLGLSDGSVQFVTSRELMLANQKQGLTTNRLQIP